MKIFVYGTLKKGFRNHSFLRGSTFLGEDKIKGFQMFNLGTYPMIVPGEGEITVEKYEVNVPTLHDIDRLEGVGCDFYDRIKIKTESGDAGDIYVASQAFLKRLTSYSIVESGNWSK